MGIGNTINNFISEMKHYNNEKKLINQFKENLPQVTDFGDTFSHAEISVMKYVHQDVNNSMVEMRILDQTNKDLDPRKGFVDIDRSCGEIEEHRTLAYNPDTEKVVSFKGEKYKSFEPKQNSKGEEYFVYTGRHGTSFTTEDGRTRLNGNLYKNDFDEYIADFKYRINR